MGEMTEDQLDMDARVEASYIVPDGAVGQLLDNLAAFAQLMEAEWYNGNLDEAAYERLNADLSGIIGKYRQLTLAAVTDKWLARSDT